ncbi:hypothetical protein T492DRAFT_831921 [Pavlovales sp. CCMP2436]|nr:hypothetical protein T492DRAFT_831921 [Pavlovales sp. CCMP2436]
MVPRPFPNVALCAYIRGGNIIDASKRISLEVLATGSQRTNVRQIEYNITRFIDEQNVSTMPNNDAQRFTFSVNTDNTISVYVDKSEGLENPNVSLGLYTKIYTPLLQAGVRISWHLSRQPVPATVPDKTVMASPVPALLGGSDKFVPG